MPPYFLTARFPWALVQGQHEERFKDSYEKDRHVFYRTDLRNVAEKLIEVFLGGLPAAAKGDPTASWSERLRILGKGGELLQFAVFGIIDGADLPVAERVAYRSAVEFLERLARGDADLAAPLDKDSPSDRRTLMLWTHHNRARQFEPRIRDAMGVGTSAQQGPAGATPRSPRPGGKRKPKAVRTEQATQCAAALRALADDFQRAAQRQRDLSAPSPAFPEIMETMTWQDHAGGVVVQAHRAGLLDLPGLKEFVAWLDGGELPRTAPDVLDNVPESEYTQRGNVLTKGEILRCTSNLWLSVIGRADLPAKNVGGELCFAPVYVGGLLADDPRMRPDRLFKHSVEARGADAAQYARLVAAADMDCSAAACRILAEKMELAAARAQEAAAAAGTVAAIHGQRRCNRKELLADDRVSVSEAADVCGKTKGRISQLCGEDTIACWGKGLNRKVSLLSAQAYFAKKAREKTSKSNATLARDARKDGRDEKRDSKSLGPV